MRKWLLWRIPALAFAASLAVASLGAVPWAEPAEDDPDFDCRVHGNQTCGFPHPSNPDVVILVHFEDGKPVRATERKLAGQVQR